MYCLTGSRVRTRYILVVLSLIPFSYILLQLLHTLLKVISFKVKKECMLLLYQVLSIAESTNQHNHSPETSNTSTQDIIPLAHLRNLPQNYLSPGHLHDQQKIFKRLRLAPTARFNVDFPRPVPILLISKALAHTRP